MTYIGCRPQDFQTTCPYLTSREDEGKTTIFPACACGMTRCDSFKGYCSVRDDK